MDKIAIMFPGQASQYAGMGKKWYERYSEVKECFDQASEIMKTDMGKLCFQGPSKQLQATENAQAAIFTVSMGMYRAFLTEEEIEPTYLAGHSLGEISALTAAGVFKFEDALKIVKARGHGMARCSHDVKMGMYAVQNISSRQVEKAMLQFEFDQYGVQIANYNTPYQTVLSGKLDGLKTIEKQLKESGARVIPLNVSGPFHSTFMQPAAGALKEALQSVKADHMKIPVISGKTGTFYASEQDFGEALMEQLVNPVRWDKVVNLLKEQGTAVWIEMGPKDVLKKFIQNSINHPCTYAYDKEPDLEPCRLQLDRVKQMKKQMPGFIGLCMGAAVCVRNTNWDNDSYQEGVVKPYKELQVLLETVEKEERTPIESEMRTALQFLKKIFAVKGVSLEEQKERICHIFEITGTKTLFAEDEMSI